MRVDIAGTTYPIHTSYVASVDPRPLQQFDIVESTLSHRPDVTGVVLAADGEEAWVRWDDDSKSVESVNHLSLIRPFGPVGRGVLGKARTR